MIGGVDLELLAPPLPDVSERIVAVCRRRWPDGVFVDANETELVALSSPDLLRKLPSAEFFVYSDRNIAETWDELEPSPENWNRMLHFLCQPRKDQQSSLTSVTVVVDELTPDIQALLDELQAAFRVNE